MFEKEICFVKYNKVILQLFTIIPLIILNIKNDTTEESREVESDLRFCLNKTGKWVGGVEEGRCRLKIHPRV